MAKKFDPHQTMADARHEFGEHGGVNMSIAASTTNTVMSPELMPEIFSERLPKLGLDVVYPGLESHPDHSLFAACSNDEYGFGGLFTLDMKTPERASKLMDLLQNEVRFGFIAVSLGYFDTLLTCPGASTSSEMGEDALHLAGISPSLVRFSIGLTGSVQERWDQLAKTIKMCD